MPSTRTVAHSLLIVVPLSFLVILFFRRSRFTTEIGTGFTVGLIAHPPADAFWPFVLGIPVELGFLFWPVTPSPPYEGQKLLVTVGGMEITTLWIELAILLVAITVWWKDGMPGISLHR